MLKLTAMQEEVAALIMETPLQGRQAARSAISHIRRAWGLKEIDKEMAAFRAITGEEESVTAFFYALKRRQYKGAEKLNPHNHVHKAAVSPYFAAISRILRIAIKMDLEPTIELNTDTSPPRFRVRLTVTMGDGEKTWIYPEPPLHYSVAINGKLHDFSEQLRDIATEQNAKSIVTHIRSLANKRNQILYSSLEGIPSIKQSIDRYLIRRKEIIFSNLILYLMIDPYREKQLFVQQALTAFLKMLKLIPEDIEFD